MWKAAYIAKASAIARERGLIGPTMEQPIYNMLRRDLVENDLPAVTETNRIGLTPFSPLAEGVLTGKYNDGIPDDSRAKIGPDFIKGYFTDDQMTRCGRCLHCW